MAVFIDGCFWHGCPRHYSRPASRQDFWDAKLQSNLMRRRKVLKQLRGERWRVVQVWECSVERDPVRVATRIAATLGA